MKKISVLLTTLVVTLASTAMTAFAADQLTTDAGVDFVQTNGPNIVDPGTDPLNPVMAGIDTKTLHFGTRARPKNNIVFDSMVGTNLNQNGITGESLAATDKQRTGLIIDNDKGDAYWRITGAVAAFMSDSKQTMKDFELTLIPNGSTIQEGNPFGPTPVPSRNTISANDLGYGTAKTFFTTGENTAPTSASKYSVGRWGVNYSGQLAVAGNSVVQDGNSASAKLLWKVELTPAP